MKKQYIKSGLGIVCLLILIVDTKTAIAGVQDGIQVCVQTAIPSLLPFIILTKYLTQYMYGSKIPILGKLGRICGVPCHMESVLGICLIGGYPIGAQMIVDAMDSKQIDKETAERMMGFCNNSGPAFIFGVCGGLFQFSYIPWLILIIQLSSAILCGVMIPEKKTHDFGNVNANTRTFAESLEASIRSMAIVCGWILCFRVVITYIDAYITMDQIWLRTLICGVLELTNGSIALKNLTSESLRFVLINGMLSFGGICVWMQISAVAKTLSMKWFYVGKVLQCIISLSLAGIIQFFLFKDDPLSARILSIAICPLMILTTCLIISSKKVVAFLKKVMYDKRNKDRLRYRYAVPKEN